MITGFTILTGYERFGQARWADGGGDIQMDYRWERDLKTGLHERVTRLVVSIEV